MPARLGTPRASVDIIEAIRKLYAEGRQPTTTAITRESGRDPLTVYRCLLRLRHNKVVRSEKLPLSRQHVWLLEL
jgi:DNA-binding IclR family transcriptional regulator